MSAVQAWRGVCNSNRAPDVPDRWRMGRSDCVRRRAATRDTDFHLNAPGEGPSQSQLGKDHPNPPAPPAPRVDGYAAVRNSFRPRGGPVPGAGGVGRSRD
jgi:hypothetical protein